MFLFSTRVFLTTADSISREKKHAGAFTLRLGRGQSQQQSVKTLLVIWSSAVRLEIKGTRVQRKDQIVFIHGDVNTCIKGMGSLVVRVKPRALHIQVNVLSHRYSLDPLSLFVLRQAFTSLSRQDLKSQPSLSASWVAGIVCLYHQTWLSVANPKPIYRWE